MSEGSSLREQQAEFTKQLLLEATRTVILENDPEDFTMPKVAKAAGVSYRTMYRYFPSRQALLDEFSNWVESSFIHGRISNEVDDDEFGTETRRLFDLFDQHPDYFEATARLSGIGLRSASHDQRTIEFRRVFDEEFPDLAPDAADKACAVLRFLSGLQSWYTLRQRFGLKDGDAGDAVAWAIDVLVAALETGVVPTRPERKESVAVDSSHDDA